MYVMYVLRVYVCVQWAGESVADKLKRMQDQIKASRAEALVVSMLDEVST